MSPDFLSVDEVVELHRIQVERCGGSDGVHDLGLLASAVVQPQTAFSGEFLHEDLFAMAAAYLFHVLKNHPFVDGNKRTGFVASLAFLEWDGLTLEEAPSQGLYALTLAVAEGRMGKAELAEAFRGLPWGPTSGA